MKIQTEVLLVDLMNRTKQLIEEAEILKGKKEEQLNCKPHAESWSALECLEHLNLYGRFYLPEIDKCIRGGKGKHEPVFKSGWLGNYFANSMLPKEKLNKMKTFKNMNPLNSQLDKRVIDEFLDQQKELLRLLEESRKISLNKTRTAISISKLIKLKLGDTFRFVIYHNQRHMVQARRIEN
ncbi:DinB family protein [Fluviicola chungangensis]|uniref:DinB family protein n=1 Tax=Fluviicola chungangensis TaxID=2597671 RepID=A0A556MYM3_9FLAO|nr:DinB family protein [Fluviicola chungangensis]TSJ45021.1 DinB family protein [Fluviicola chungangensis]